MGLGRGASRGDEGGGGGTEGSKWLAVYLVGWLAHCWGARDGPGGWAQLYQLGGRVGPCLGGVVPVRGEFVD